MKQNNNLNKYFPELNQKPIQQQFIKSPFNYIGGKYKLLPQLYELFPPKVDTFVDLFGGGFNVGLNAQAENIVYNDQLTPLVELFQYLQQHDTYETLDYIEETILRNNLSKENKETYNKFREKYNNSPYKHPLDLYILVSFSFNYQFRFNNNGEFNNPHGTNRSSFTRNMKKRLIQCINRLHQKNITFLNKDFTEINFKQLTHNSLVYCDPPYLITTGSYNDGNRGFKNWTLTEEHSLYQLLDYLNAVDIKFVLSNVLVHDGKVNDVLKKWLSKNEYNVRSVVSDYSNSNYHKKVKNNKGNHEILVYNY